MRTYGNVGVLDIRNAQKEDLENIKIGNAGILIQSQENPSLSGMINSGNVGRVIEIPREGKVFTGDQVINSSFLEGFEEPAYMLILGKVRFTEDVTSSLVERTISELNVLFHDLGTPSPGIVCEESLAPTLKKKMKENPISIQTHPRGALIWEGKINFDSSRLKYLEKNSSLVILGSVTFSQDLNPDSLLEKVSNIQVTKKVTIPEELINSLKKIISQPGTDRWEILPAGFRLIEGNLKLNQSILDSYKGQKLFLKGSLHLEADISPEKLERSLAELQVTGDIIAPEKLIGTVVALTGEAEEKILTFPENLHLVEGDTEMYPEDLDFLPDRFTLIVKGALKLDPGIEGSELHSRVDYLDNLGMIYGTPGQIAALRSRQRKDRGFLKKHGEKSNEDERQKERYTIGNVGYLRL